MLPNLIKIISYIEQKGQVLTILLYHVTNGNYRRKLISITQLKLCINHFDVHRLLDEAVPLLTKYMLCSIHTLKLLCVSTLAIILRLSHHSERNLELNK